MHSERIPVKRLYGEAFFRKLFTGLMFVLLLEFLLRMAFYNGNGTAPLWVTALRFAAASLGVLLTRKRRDRVFCLMFLFVLWIGFRALVRGREAFHWSVLKSLVDIFWAFGGCYSLALVLSGSQTRRFLFSFGCVWTAAMLFVAVLGIHAAWMRAVIPNLSGTCAIRLWGEADQARLNLVYGSTLSGELMAVSALIALLLALGVRRKAVRVLFILSVFPMLLALCLTDSRTAQINFSAGLAALSGIALWSRPGLRSAVPGAACEAPGSSGHRGGLSRVLPALAAAALVFAVSLFLLRQVNPFFDQLKHASQSWPILRSGALSDDGQILMSNRDLWGESALTGREEIWKAVLKYLRTHPRYLLIGKSILNPMDDINRLGLISFQASHCHSILLQVLLESGLPGLILLLLIVREFGKRILLLAGNRSLPRWQRCFPALIVAICVGELAECFTLISFSCLPFLAFLNLSAGCVSAGCGAPEANLSLAGLCLRISRAFACLRKACACLARLVRRYRPGLIAALFVLCLLLPRGNRPDCPVLRQDDFDDPVRDLYYTCGDPSCETHGGFHTVKSSGCGACAVVNAARYMTGEAVDIHDVAAFVRENGQYIVHQGSKGSLYQTWAELEGPHLGIRYVGHAETIEETAGYLKQGCVAIACAANTKGGGHILVLADYCESSGRFLILDSAGNYPGWSRSFASWQAIPEGRPEHNPDILLYSFWIWSAGDVSYYGS